MEEALKTGWFVGIGEFAPGSSARNLQIPGAEGKVSFEQRVDEWAALCELAVKYDVPVLCHDQFVWAERRGLDPHPAASEESRR